MRQGLSCILLPGDCSYWSRIHQTVRLFMQCCIKYLRRRAVLGGCTTGNTTNCFVLAC